MIDLKRASAGSGKTYQLAKYYIRYLISIKPEGEKRRRLRTDAELKDALGRILAITFTNKATEEMQRRIVDRLDALGNYTGEGEKPDYLDDFSEEFGASPDRIATVCRKALKIILNDYSNFNVSTIDSFFQRVLRTFAYESGYNDNYQVELDGKYVSRMGIDLMLDEVDTLPESHNPGRRWLEYLMNEEKGNGWNIFRKEKPTKGYGTNPYRTLIADFEKIENEEFRLNSGKIKDYFENTEQDFDTLYDNLKNYYQKKSKELYDKLRDKARNLDKVLDDSIRIGGNRVEGKIGVGLKKIKKQNGRYLDKEAIVAEKDLPKYLPDSYFEGKMKDIYHADPHLWEERKRLYTLYVDAFLEWQRLISGADFRMWRILKRSFPFMGLLQLVLQKRREFLEENNAVELGATSVILNRIIGDDDTPFVYERMGTRLNHFLIDEFQDTSQMQWNNVSPLLKESLGYDHDNLIIGDAKQSIYRFRNANPKLISEMENSEFGAVVISTGDKVSTNYRSDYNIVEWNNRLFEYIVGELPHVTENRGPEVAEKFGKLYSEVRQKSDHPDGGYVRVDLPENKDSILDDVIGIILDALARGYQYRDIAILVRRNTVGIKMVEKLRMYNLSRLPDEPALEFVSEESLLVGKSSAVRQILVVLESIARGCRQEIDRSDDKKGSVASIYDIELGLLLYCTRHPELPLSQCVEEYLNSDPDMGIVIEMLEEIQTMALPALVEAIAGKFLDEETRRRDAPFIAAFQDCVLEYCETHPSDIRTFLVWWERKGEKLAISSPEDADAIKILTIHKSKGLEYPVVIIPELIENKTALGDYVGGKEWTWVDSKQIYLEGMPEGAKLPPRVPVNITYELSGTVLESKLHEAYNDETMDTLNTMYVAMTRAVNELYMFVPVPKKETAKTGSITPGSLLRGFAHMLSEEADTPLYYMKEEDEEYIEYGVKPEHKRSTGDKKTEDVERIVITDYYSRTTPDFIRFREAGLAEYIDAEEYDIDRDSNPRSIGNICHALMERIKVIDDLPAEVSRAKLLGLMPPDSDYGSRLLVHLERMKADTGRWFDGSAVRIISERPVLRRGMKLRRPDRVMVYEEGKVEVVDYKFGKIDHTGKYGRQVRNYVKYLKDTGEFRTVKGYLWYVFEDKVELVSQ